MKIWTDLTLDNKKKDLKDRFEYTNKALNLDENTALDLFKFENFKKNELYFAQYKYFTNRLSDNTLFLASGYGFYEFFLKGNFKNFICSDTEETYIKFNTNNNLSNFIKLDITKHDDLKKINFIPNNIILNNVEYLLDDHQLISCLNNISLISNKNTKIYIIFRSRYYYLINLFYKFLIPVEFKIKKYKENFLGKQIYINNNFHGYLRTKKEFENILEKNFLIEDLFEDLFTVDYNRSSIINKLKLGKILSFIFFKSHPYLHIYKLKKNN